MKVRTLVVAVILLGLTRLAAADNYNLFAIGSDDGRSIYGIDSSGTVVVRGGVGCGFVAATCYATYTNGVATADTSTAPDLLYDNGTSCDSTPAGYIVSKSICNNGWIGFGSFAYPSGGPLGAYTGSGSNLFFLSPGTADQVFINSSGDFAWDDGRDDLLFVAIRNGAPQFQSLAISDPAPMPEPGSILFVGTGFLALISSLGIRRHKFCP